MKEAEALVEEIKVELDKQKAKNHICNALKLLSNDVSNISVGVISGVVASLATGATITLPIITLPSLGIGIASLILVRTGLELYCPDN